MKISVGESLVEGHSLKPRRSNNEVEPRPPMEKKRQRSHGVAAEVKEVIRSLKALDREIGKRVFHKKENGLHE